MIITWAFSVNKRIRWLVMGGKLEIKKKTCVVLLKKSFVFRY